MTASRATSQMFIAVPGTVLSNARLAGGCDDRHTLLAVCGFTDTMSNDRYCQCERHLAWIV